MATENGLIGDTDLNKASTSKTCQEPEKDSNMNGENQNLETGKGDEKTNTVPFYKLFAFADRTDILLMIVGTIGSIANGLSMPLLTILFGELTDSFGENQNNNEVLDAVSEVALKFVYLAVGAAVAGFLQVTCWMVTGERQAARIRGLYLKTILRQDIAFFDVETNTGEVVGRMSGDTVLIQDAMGEKVGKFIQLMSLFIGGFVVAFIKGWLLTLVMLSCLPLLVIAGAVVSLIIANTASQGQNAYAKAATVVEQTIGSIRTVASFTGENQAISNYKKFLVSAYKSGVYQGSVSGLGLGMVTLVAFCSYALAVWFGGKMILEKGYTGGQVMSVMVAVLAGSTSLGQASPCINAFASGQAAAFKMFETIERKPEIDAYDTKGKILEDIRGDIDLRDVCFSYPARPEEQIFNGFSLSIPSGTTAALVGQSGSGKSTVISLIQRFYDPQAGEVLIDGINLKEFQLKWIRGKIGLVSQEPVLFTGSIRDNIAYGKEGATSEEIRAAAEIANAAKFIDKLPQGLDTMVGEHGTQLSGGQKQRVAIARAILKDPRILLLDEATSALDAESERIVQEALDRIMVNRTTVIVAHRLSTVRNAKMIAVVHRGKMVEKGSHSELLKDPNGAYSQLIRLQEVSKELEQVPDDENGLDITEKSLGQTSLQMSLKKSISKGSSAEGNSSRHSFSASSGLPTGMNPRNSVPADAAAASSTIPSVQASDVSIRRLASFNKPEIPVLLLGSIASIINGLVLPTYALLLSEVIKTFYKPPNELKKDSRFWALIFMALGLASFLAISAERYLFSVAGCKLIQRIRSMCFEKVVCMEIGWFDEPDHSSGSLGARLSADAATLNSLVGDALAQMVQSIVSVVAGLVIAFVASWQLALITIVLLPLIGINGYVQVKFVKGFSADAKMMYEEASQVATDAVGGIRTIASFCAEEMVMRLYKKKCEHPVKAGIRQGLISGIGFGVSYFLLYSVIATDFYAGAQFVKHGHATFSDVFQVFFALTIVAASIPQSSALGADSSKAKNAAASIFAIMDRMSKIDPNDESGVTLENVKGEIELSHVSFKYPLRPDIQIFQDLCLDIPAGKTVALVGESGSGKSTVISLLQRFYDIDSGHITLDSVEIQKLQLKWLRQQMGLVSQEPVLFNDTIRANIAYGKRGNATEAEILAAAELANAHKFISSLQQGYDTVVGERGVQLSGGQKQRVAIARAIVKSPKILLLDEATSALDAESEQVVQDALDRVMVNRTTLVVAHRLSTIKNADIIAVVKNGVIVEKGKHETLINIKNGFYASLVALHMSASTA
ncbi:hypothetical protein COLO4_23135 [Corchorus olitorius]|uniref:ABC transporter-like protein n=1 Tax=Corchorus olitorius TaxID=93759 RepID=A0A1R3II57_9ROSI|nr:hypothetical protein COLO4_23135 [Corchorus olitorius]